jgi:hypothetical protein
VRELGVPGDVVASYLSEGHTALEPGFADLSGAELRRSSKQTEGSIRFEAIRLADASDQTTSIFFEGEPMRITLSLSSAIRARQLEILCKISTLEGTLVCTLASGEFEVEIEPGSGELDVDVPSLPFRRGNYQIDLYMRTNVAQDELNGAIEFEIAGPRKPVDDFRRHQYLGVVNVEQEWGLLRQAVSKASV